MFFKLYIIINYTLWTQEFVKNYIILSKILLPATNFRLIKINILFLSHWSYRRVYFDKAISAFIATLIIIRELL